MQRRVQDCFSVLLPVADAVRIFGEKIKLSHITEVPQAHLRPWLILNMSENPDKVTPSVDFITDREVAPELMQFGRSFPRILQDIYGELGPSQDVHSSTRALIWVHFKTVNSFSRPIFSLFSHLNSVWHNSVIELYCALQIIQNILLQLFIKVTRSFVAIELFTFCKNAKFIFYCSRELSLFWLDK